MAPPRSYRLGRRQAAVDRTHSSILAAARSLLEAGPAAELSVDAVARAAGVSRLTVYNRFGSRAGLLDAIAPPPPPPPAAGGHPAPAAGEELRLHIAATSAHWASAPALFRNLEHVPAPAATDVARGLAERLAAADELRPGCSIKEAEDVIAALTSFPVFDRLHRDGRRSPAAVADILCRLASAILA